MIPFLGGCRLAETDRTVARNYITALAEEGRSANTIRQAKVVLGAMFGMAVADGYLDYNPFHDVKIPKARYVHVLDETGESAARRFEGLLPPL